MKQKLTQKDLVFGLYWGDKKGPNPGLNIWLGCRYIWPLHRHKVVKLPKSGTLFQVSEASLDASAVKVAEII